MDISQFKKEFMDEANKQLAVMNNSLSNVNEKSLKEVSIAVHILKSSAAAMGFNQTAKLSKTIEETLNEILNKKIEINPAITDVLAESISTLIELIKAVDKGEKENNVDKLIAKLKNILS